MSLLYGITDAGTKIKISDYKNEKVYSPLRKKLRAKRGKIKVWHYAHVNENDRDNWADPIMTEWHKSYQNICNKDNVEYRIERDKILHIADIYNDGLVIELQHSPITEEIIKEREKFYNNMIWLFDYTTTKENPVNKGSIQIQIDNIVKIKLNGPIKKTTKTTFYDVGDNLLRVLCLSKDTRCVWCQQITRKDFFDMYFNNIKICEYSETSNLSSLSSARVYIPQIKLQKSDNSKENLFLIKDKYVWEEWEKSLKKYLGEDIYDENFFIRIMSDNHIETIKDYLAKKQQEKYNNEYNDIIKEYNNIIKEGEIYGKSNIRIEVVFECNNFIKATFPMNKLVSMVTYYASLEKNNNKLIVYDKSLFNNISKNELEYRHLSKVYLEIDGYIYHLFGAELKNNNNNKYYWFEKYDSKTFDRKNTSLILKNIIRSGKKITKINLKYMRYNSVLYITYEERDKIKKEDEEHFMWDEAIWITKEIDILIPVKDTQHLGDYKLKQECKDTSRYNIEAQRHEELNSTQRLQFEKSKIKWFQRRNEWIEYITNFEANEAKETIVLRQRYGQMIKTGDLEELRNKLIQDRLNEEEKNINQKNNEKWMTKQFELINKYSVFK